MRAVFDTNILIDFLNGVPDAATEIKLYSDRIISIISYMEVMVGAKTSGEEQTVRSFLRSFAIANLSPAIAEEAIRIRRNLSIRLPDAIIYGTAKQQACILVTRNFRDFAPTLPDIRMPYTVAKSTQSGDSRG